uniref:AN1-type domain-containing protein n=1 Tax=Oryza meridionalis TaxID=40149 RepID=A0A0E0ERT5_9ORYZ
MARRGTEAFPDLGAQCDREDCNQLDFLPFDCDGCGRTFCAEHRTYRDHGCARAADQGRTVVVCEACGDAIERRAGDGDDAAVLEAHARSRRCDPARKRKPRCPVPRCKETLTFSNTSGCKGCGHKVCLKHRFPADHACAGAGAGAASKAAGAAAAARSAGQCGRDAQKKEGGGWKLPQSVRNMKIF